MKPGIFILLTEKELSMIVKTKLNWHDLSSQRVTKKDLLGRIDLVNDCVNPYNEYKGREAYEGKLVLHVTEDGLYMLAELLSDSATGAALAVTKVPMTTREMYFYLGGFVRGLKRRAKND